jgi:tyrosine-protein phosphatase SIW14
MSLSSRLPIAFLVFGLPAFCASAPGIKNFDQVDEHVYRGGQPTEAGFKYLASLGVKNIIDLREADSRATDEERAVTAAGMNYINVPMTGLTPPREAEMVKILTLLEDASAGPVFVHCKRGADRTGAVIAAYHIEHDKWDNQRALKDAMSHGMSFFQFPRQGCIKTFQARTLDASGSKASTAGAAGPVTVAPKN